MEIKGTAVTAIRDHVKLNFPEKYNNWLTALSAESQEIYSGVIDSSKWYALIPGCVEPTRKTGDLFYKGNYEKCAWECGRYSAEKGLTGIYKIFVKASSPAYIIQRASRVFATYYQPCKMEVTDKTENGVTVDIANMDQKDIVVEYRIGGWIEKALEISGAQNIQMEFPQSIARGDEVTRIKITWE